MLTLITKRYSVVVLTIIQLLTAAGLAVALYKISDNNHRICTTIGTIVSVPYTKPADPVAQPAQEELWEEYISIEKLRQTWKCLYPGEERMKFTNKVYDFLKSVALIWLPALSTLYFALGSIWRLSDVAQVVGSATALDTFLGVILGLSSKGYIPSSDGNLLVDQSDPTKDIFTLEVTSPLEELPGKKSIMLNVTPVNVVKEHA